MSRKIDRHWGAICAVSVAIVVVAIYLLRRACAHEYASVGAEFVLIGVLWIEGIIAYQHMRQDSDHARKGRTLDIKLDIARRVDELRVDGGMIALRKDLDALMGQEPNTERDAKLRTLWETGCLPTYLARVNHLCWVIEQCGDDMINETAELVSGNLIKQWTFLESIIDEHDTRRGDKGWYLAAFRRVVSKLSKSVS